MRHSKRDDTRFWKKVHKLESGCWEWQASVFPSGYGQFTFNGYPILAHRVSYCWKYGALPFLLRHTCDNKVCVNPSHLVPGTHKDNATDMVVRGRSRKGERNPAAKLTYDQVQAIRIDPRFQRVIAKEYNVARSTISAIKTGDTWHGPVTCVLNKEISRYEA